MRLLGLDFETTGLDTGNDRVVEMGLVLWDVETKRPLATCGVFLYDEGIEKKFTPEVTEMMNRVCGITPEILREFGTDAKSNFQWLQGFAARHGADYIVAHNGENYDKPLLMAELARHGLDDSPLKALPWLDTRADIPFASEPDSRKLKHLALDCGFINPFAHRAVFDVLTMLRVLSNYPLEGVIAYSQIPWVTIRAVVDYDDREKAKARRFSWENLGDKKYPKQWVKKIKESQLEDERAALAPFKVLVV